MKESDKNSEVSDTNSLFRLGESESSDDWLCVISGFPTFRQTKAPVAALEPATEGSLLISSWVHYPLCHLGPEGIEERIMRSTSEYVV
ncbi:hypothetical protein PoB_002356000 [Plakobranchus ocellatus]|uniref:Uncharacterized protein n=1 Tax=Plakobranchus ocellatus TaxID=259542 RepID=A0AAV3ZMZ3_9GAST|nr:hypothetical protein PoB_002356000 [Plakobranchus ocellatus]